MGGALIEVLVAAIILAGGLFSLISFQANLLRERSLVSQRAAALTLAQDKLQGLRNYTVIATTGGQFAYDDIVSGTSSTTMSGASYTLTWTVAALTNPTRKTASVTTTWTDAVNTAQSITVNTIINRIDPSLAGKVAQGL